MDTSGTARVENQRTRRVARSGFGGL